MNERRYSIAPEVFQRFPGYVRGVVLAWDVRNGASPEELVSLLRREEASLRDRLAGQDVAAYPRIASWREAFRSLGIKPAEFRSSIEAMARRVVKGQELPSINALVDIGNVISLRHLVPTGGHAIDVVTGNLALRPATGEEEFVAFGTDVMEHPDRGEFVFVEGNTVLTRRWSWRQANHTLTLPDTTAIEFNIDGLPPVPEEEVRAIRTEVQELVARFCGGRFLQEILSQENPEISLEEA